ncbi:MAG TPA: NAD(P)/FAD-dependent oxidoreductase [Methanomassiliicoccales archaeon]|jgi:thioredoxin reductase (NADPH)
MVYDLVIVGAGPAGLTAGVYAMSRKLKTLIIDAGDAGGQLINVYPEKTIANYPSVTEIHAHELGWSMVDHAKSSGCEIREHEVVKDIVDKGEGLVVISDKGEYETKTVILAIGTGLFMPKMLGAPGEERLKGRGVFHKLPEKKDLAGKRILFVGGGNSALEMALLASEVAQVYIVHRRDCFRADGCIVDRVVAKNIKTIMSAEVKEILGEDKVDGAVLNVGDPPQEMRLDVDMVVINIGVTPELEFLEKWKVALEGNQIKVDTEMRTSRRSVFACGDTVVYPGKYRQIVVACGEGATAANSVYKYVMKPYWA